MAKKYVIGSILAVVLIYFIMARIDVKESVEMLRGLDPRILGICALLYLASHLFRTLRFRALLGEGGVPFRELFAIVFIYYFLNNIMPMKTGEGSYPVMVNRVGGVGYSKGIASLMAAKAHDLAAIILLFVLFFIYEVARFHDSGIYWYITILGLVAVLSLYVFRHMDKVLGFLVRGIGLVRIPKADRHMNGLLEFAEDFRAVCGNAGYYRLVLSSVCVWLLNFALYYVFVSRLDGGMDFPTAALGSGGSIAVSMLPINSIGSVGTLEAGWTLGYVTAGMDKEAALASGVLMHVFIIVYGLLLSLVGFAMLRRGRRA